MSKPNTTSYEGFRRKSSLNSLEANKTHNSPDITLLKFKNNEQFSEVESLSMQLDSLSKRSLTARSHNQQKLSKSYSSISFNDTFQLGSSHSHFNSNSHFCNENTTLNKNQIENGEGFNSSVPQKRQKISSSAVFNKFQIIEEDNYLNEEEVIEPIETKTLKINLPTKITQKRPTTSKNGTTKTIPTPVRKIVTIKQETGSNYKKQKLKLDINEIDKMQKQFQNKRVVREQLNTKAHLQTQIGKRVQRVVVKETIKTGLKQSLQFEGKTHVEANNRINRNLKQSLNMPSKVVEVKPESILMLDEQKSEQFNEAPDQMIATRMLTTKQKEQLIKRVLNLRDIIQKNEICQNSVVQLKVYMSKIQQLLTR